MPKNIVSVQERIDAQRAIAASLLPGSRQHELATKVLLLMQDSLYLLTEINALTAEAERLRQGPCEGAVG